MLLSYFKTLPADKKMDAEDFKLQLNEAQKLMSAESYKQALDLLNKLKAIEKENNFDYNITHRLYQLLSNCQSLYNQHVILKFIKKLKSQKKASITLQELKQILKDEIAIEESIIGREVELLILRGILPCKLERNKIIF